MMYLDLSPFTYGDNPDEINRLMELEFQRMFDFIWEQLNKKKIAHVSQENMGMSEYLVINLYDKKSQFHHLSDDTDLHYPINGEELLEEHKERILEKVFKYRGGVYIWKKISEKDKDGGVRPKKLIEAAMRMKPDHLN
ncbi:hypothetical protein [Arsenophonus sp.]|uniref:hypothetical protein n=1 Tax=Arsenophonus sp. TaxID=1872640 RepID=UPI0028664E59|nr:hypothetical protein [Arsenophonus sp.]MDR5614635.1 hypothetical protein [Arsenophonus sp.]